MSRTGFLFSLKVLGFFCNLSGSSLANGEELASARPQSVPIILFPQVKTAQYSSHTYLTKETIQEFLENGLLHDDLLFSPVKKKGPVSGTYYTNFYN